MKAFEELAEAIVGGQSVSAVTVGSVQIGAEVSHDSDAHPSQSDCYSPEDIAAFGETWRYVGIQLTVKAYDVTASASLWAVEQGLVSREAERKYLAESILPNLYGECVDGYVNARDAVEEAWQSL